MSGWRDKPVAPWVEPPADVAALFVEANGVYADLPGVDPWDAARDARLYDGPHPVVCHPPCGRWSMLAPLVRSRYGYPIGSDGGCFASALASLKRWGGVLEHPALSKAWKAFGLLPPLPGGGWTSAEPWKGRRAAWTCEVAQRNYGHRARKRTWLLSAGVPLDRLPVLEWGDGERPEVVIGTGAQWINEQWQRGQRTVEHMSHRERKLTPPAFKDVLLAIARSVER